MGSSLRRLKRHGCPYAKARAHAMERMETELILRGRELTKAGRERVLDQMAAEQAERMQAADPVACSASGEYYAADRAMLALMSEQSRTPRGTMGGD